MLIGEYTNTVDDKGRILFPSKLKSQLENDELIITQGFDNNLLIMDKVNFQNLIQKMTNDPAKMFDRSNRILLRKLNGPARDIEFDKSNRFLIPANLRDSVSLLPKQEAIFIGLSDYIEVWNAQEYEKFLDETEDEFESASQEFALRLREQSQCK